MAILSDETGGNMQLSTGFLLAESEGGQWSLLCDESDIPAPGVPVSTRAPSPDTDPQLLETGWSVQNTSGYGPGRTTNVALAGKDSSDVTIQAPYPPAHSSKRQ